MIINFLSFSGYIRITYYQRNHPYIKDVQVIGVPSEKYGEEVAAFIRLKEGQTLTPQGVQNYCKGKIASWKIPRYIFFIDQYPLTTSGKVKKSKLREVALETLKSNKLQ